MDIKRPDGFKQTKTGLLVPSSEDYQKAHAAVDTDQSDQAIHHTLGTQAGQAAAGNHTKHSGDSSGWVPVTLQNSWVNYGAGFATASYRKINGVVYIKGLIKNGTTTTGTVLWTLPAGYRPAERMGFTVQGSGPVMVRIDILTNGDVTGDLPNLNATYTFLDGINFPVG